MHAFCAHLPSADLTGLRRWLCGSRDACATANAATAEPTIGHARTSRRPGARQAAFGAVGSARIACSRGSVDPIPAHGSAARRPRRKRSADTIRPCSAKRCDRALDVRFEKLGHTEFAKDARSGPRGNVDPRRRLVFSSRRRVIERVPLRVLAQPKRQHFIVTFADGHIEQHVTACGDFRRKLLSTFFAEIGRRFNSDHAIAQRNAPYPLRRRHQRRKPASCHRLLVVYSRSNASL